MLRLEAEAIQTLRLPHLWFSENAPFLLLQFFEVAKTATKVCTQAIRAMGIKQFYKHGN